MSDEPRDLNGEEGAPEEPAASEERPADKPAETSEPAAPVASEPAAEGGSDESSEDAGVEDAAAAAREEAEAKEKAAADARAKAEAAAEKKAAHEAAEAAKDPWERDPKPPEWEEADDDPLAEALRERHGEAIES